MYRNNMGYLKKERKKEVFVYFGLPIIRTTLPPAGRERYRSTLPVNIKSTISGRFFVLNQQKGNMPRRIKYVPVVGSRLSDSQSGVSQPDKMTVSTASLTQRRRDRPLTKQANVGLLKIKLPKFRKVEKKPDKSSRKWTIEAVADASVCGEEAALNPHTGGWNAH